MEKLLGNSNVNTNFVCTPWFILYGDNFYSPLDFETVKDTLNWQENAFDHSYTNARDFIFVEYVWGHYHRPNGIMQRLTTHPIIDEECQFNICNLYWIDARKNPSIADGESIYQYNDEMLGTTDVSESTWNNISKFETFLYLWDGRLILTEDRFRTYIDLGYYPYSQILTINQEYDVVTLYSSESNIIDVNLEFDNNGRYKSYSIIPRDYKYIINGQNIKSYKSGNYFYFGTSDENLLSINYPLLYSDQRYEPMITKMPASDGSLGYDYFFNYALPNGETVVYDNGGDEGPGVITQSYRNYKFKITETAVILTRGVDFSISDHVDDAQRNPDAQINTSLRQIDAFRTEFIFSTNGEPYNIQGVGVIFNIDSVDMSLPNITYLPTQLYKTPQLWVFPHLKTWDIGTSWKNYSDIFGKIIHLESNNTYSVAGVDTYYLPADFIDYQDRRYERTSDNKLILHSSAEGRIKVYPKYSELLFNSEDVNNNVPLTQRGTMNIITVEHTGEYSSAHKTMKISLKLNDDESYFVTDHHVLEPVVSGSAVRVYNLEIEYGTSIDVAIMLMNANPFDIDISVIGQNDAYPDPEEIVADIYSGKIYSPEIVNLSYIILDSNANQQSVYPYAEEVYTLADHKIMSLLPDNTSTSNIINLPGIITSDIINDLGVVVGTNILTHKIDADGIFYYRNPDDILLINLFGIFISCTVKNLVHLSDFKPFVGLYDVRMLNALRIMEMFNAYADEGIADGHVYINVFSESLRLNSIDDLKNASSITALIQQSSPALSESDLMDPFNMFEILSNLLSERNFNIDVSKPKISIHSSSATLQEGSTFTITVTSNIQLPDTVKVRLNSVSANYVPDGNTNTDITFSAADHTFDSNNTIIFTINIADNNYNNLNEIIASTITVYDSSAFADDYGIANYYGMTKTYSNQTIVEARRVELLIEAGIDQTFILDNLTNGFIAPYDQRLTYKIFNSELSDSLNYVLVNYLADNTESFARIHAEYVDVVEGDEAYFTVNFDNYPIWNEKAFVTIRFTDAVLGHQVFSVETFSLLPGTLTYNHSFKIMVDDTLDNDYSFNVELVSVWVGDYEMSLVDSALHNEGRLITYNVTSREVTDDAIRYGTFFSIYPCNFLQYSYFDEFDADVGGANNYYTQDIDLFSGRYTLFKNKQLVFRIGSMILGDIPAIDAKYCKSYMTPMDLFANEIDRSINSIKVNNVNRVLMGLNTNNFQEVLSVNLDTTKAFNFSHAMIDWSDPNAVAEVAGMLGITLPSAASTYLSFRTMMISVYGEHNLDPMITVSAKFVNVESDGSHTPVNEFTVGTPVYLIATVNSVPLNEVRVLLNITSPSLIENEHFTTSSHQVIINAGTQTSDAIEINMVVPENYVNSFSYYGTLNATVNAILDNPTGSIPGAFPYINITDESLIKIKDYVNVML